MYLLCKDPLLFPLPSSLPFSLLPLLPFPSSLLLAFISFLFPPVQTYLSVAVRRKLQSYMYNNLLPVTSSSLLLDTANLQWSIPPPKTPSAPMKIALLRAYHLPQLTHTQVMLLSYLRWMEMNMAPAIKMLPVVFLWLQLR